MQCHSDVYRSSLLHYAAESAHSDFIPHLIDVGIDINCMDEDSDTPFTLCMCVYTNQGYDIHKILKEFDDRGFNYVRFVLS